MKILILQDHLRLGGTETQALALGQLWLDAGHDVRLVVFRPDGELAEAPATKRLRPVILQRFNSCLDGWAPRLVKTVASLAPDVVVAFGREANAKLPKVRQLSPGPLLVGTLRSGREQFKSFWTALRDADLVIANSRWTAKEAAMHGVAKDKLHFFYSGLARTPLPADAMAARADWRQRTHTPEEAVILLCVAGFRRGKGQDWLLRAAAKLPVDLPWRLWFAGSGPCLKSCQKLARELNLAERVHFTGMVPDPASLYAAADVAVMSSQAEALPNFLIEAQAAGLPVVATAVGGVPECFSEGQTGLGVPPGDALALTAALARAIRDHAWRAAARAPAQARAQELFDAHRNAAKWLELFERKI